MRKFLHEYESIVTMEELEAEFNKYHKEFPEDSFDYWLSCCMWWNNGSLTEILTAGTPKAERRRAVSRVAVFSKSWYGEDINFPFVTWATAAKIRDLLRGGSAVVPYLGKWE